MITLSYSSLNILHNCPHNWLNKQMGIQQQEKPEWKEGKAAHRIIQDHVSGAVIDKRLSHITYKFPIVEKVDFDKDCKFSFGFYGMEIIGFYDGIDPMNRRFLEIKTSSNPWSMYQYSKSWQRKLYALSNESFKESVIITGSRKPEEWQNDRVRFYTVPATSIDREEASDWISEGINILKRGDFTKDLVDGLCVDPWCFWGVNCQFKKQG